MTPIRNILTAHGSDKDTDHAYGPAYDALFDAESRAAVRSVLEVGVQDGASLRAWAEIFPNARVYGVDLAVPAGVAGGRIHAAAGDAADPRRLAAALAAMAAPPTFDVIIDDGSHRYAEQLATARLLRPRLAAGGTYVIEDVQPFTPAGHLAEAVGGKMIDLRPAKCRFDDVLVVAGPWVESVSLPPVPRFAPPAVVCHLACAGDWRRAIREHAVDAMRAGLRDWHVTLCGADADTAEAEALLRAGGVRLEVHDRQSGFQFGEGPALRLVRQLAGHAAAVLYFHAAGVGDAAATALRKTVAQTTVLEWPRRLLDLHTSDLVGVNWAGDRFSGNGWVGRGAYLARLPEIDAGRTASWVGAGAPQVKSLLCAGRGPGDEHFRWLCHHTALWHDAAAAEAEPSPGF